MFFNDDYVTNTILNKAWLSAHNIDSESQDAPITKVCKTLEKNHKKLSLKSFATLVNGAAKIYYHQLEQAIADAAELVFKINLNSYEEFKRANDLSLSSSLSITPEAMRQSERAIQSPGSPILRPSRRTSIFEVNCDRDLPRTTLLDVISHASPEEMIELENRSGSDDDRESYEEIEEYSYSTEGFRRILSTITERTENTHVSSNNKKSIGAISIERPEVLAVSNEEDTNENTNNKKISNAASNQGNEQSPTKRRRIQTKNSQNEKIRDESNQDADDAGASQTRTPEGSHQGRTAVPSPGPGEVPFCVTSVFGSCDFSIWPCAFIYGYITMDYESEDE